MAVRRNLPSSIFCDTLFGYLLGARAPMLQQFHRWLNDDASAKDATSAGAASCVPVYVIHARCNRTRRHAFCIFVTVSDFILGLYDVGGEVRSPRLRQSYIRCCRRVTRARS